MTEKNIAEEKKERIRRQSAIVQAVQNHKIKTQVELVRILNNEYNIETNQPTVSRDVKELKLGKDDETRTYILEPIAERNKEARELARLLRKSNALQFEMSMGTILLQADIEYAPLIGAQIEKFLKADSIQVGIFIGLNGSILIVFPQSNENKIRRHLKKIFEHNEKKKEKR